MKFSVFGCISCLALFGLLPGCAGHNVKYLPFVKQRIPQTTHAVSMTGSFEEAKACFEKSQLPHNSPRKKCELMLEGLEKLTAQLGSHDYVLIGEVFGGGNAWANQATLTEAFCKKAARNGGDVVMVFRRATVEQPYVYTTPGIRRRMPMCPRMGTGIMRRRTAQAIRRSHRVRPTPALCTNPRRTVWFSNTFRERMRSDGTC